MMLISSEFDLNMACRTCLSNGKMISLYKRNTTETSLAEMLMSCTSVNYYENDGLATQICLECVSEINRSYKFAMKCKMSDDKLQQHLKGNLTPALSLIRKEVDHETNNAPHNLKENKHIENACVPEINKPYENIQTTIQIRNDLYDSIPTVKNKIDLKLSDPLNINHIENISTGNMRSELLEVQNQDLKNEMNCDHQIEQSLPIMNILPNIDIHVGVKIENDSEIISPNLDPLEIGISSEFEYKQENESLTAQSSKLSSERIKPETLDGTESEANTWQSNETQELQPINKISIEIGKYESIVSLVDQLSTSSTLPRECIVSAVGNAIENSTNSSLKSRELQKSLITNITKVRKTKHNTRSFQNKSPIPKTSSFYKLRKRTSCRQPDMEKNIEDSQSDSLQNSDCESMHSNYEDSESESSNNDDYQSETSSDLESINKTGRTKHSTSLSNNVNLHTKPFKCNVCGKLFSKNHNLQTHMSLHNKKTMYACTKCDKSFKAPVYLLEHSQKHHNVTVLNNMISGHFQNLKNKPLMFEATDSFSKLLEQTLRRQPDIENNNEDSHNATSQTNDSEAVHSNCKENESESSNNKDCQTETSNNLKSNNLKNLTEHSTTEAQKDDCQNDVSNNEDHLSEQFNNTENYTECSNSKNVQPCAVGRKSISGTTVNTKLFKCNICESSFGRISSLKCHMLVHKKNNVHVCKICGKSFISQINLNAHILMHPSSKKYKCQVCDYPFGEAAALETHMKVHTGENPLSCSFCGKLFSELSSLKIHMQSHDDDKPYNCSKCDRWFAFEEYLAAHMLVHTDVKKYKCEVCSRLFRKSSFLRNHIFTHTGEKPYSCTVCGKKFVSNFKLQVHTRTHAKEKPFSCVICNHSFTANSEINSHMSVHFGQGFICSVCGKKFMVYSSLRNHLKIHDEKKHTCVICDMSYNSHRSLYEHMQIKHPKTEPVTCAICNKSFATKKSLSKHMRVHSNEKPFSCLICNKSFGLKRTLKTHMKTHSNERSHSCTVCNKEFKLKQHLELHMRTHNDDRAFACTLCDLKFKLQHHLKAHVKRKHPSKN